MMPQLSEELVQLIFSHLRVSTSAPNKRGQIDRVGPKTLASACLVSKTFLRVAQPELYHTLDLRYYGSPRRLLTSIAHRRELAACVRKVYIESWATQEDVDNEGPTTSPPEPALASEFSQLVEAIAFSTPLQDRLLVGLRDGLEDAEFALLLASCWNVEFLQFSAVFDLPSTLTAEVVRAASTQANDTTRYNPPLRRIHELHVDHWDTEDSTDLADLSGFLQLPALETLHGNMLSLGEESEPLPTSNLKQVSLQWSVFDASGFSNLLSACPQLTSLTVEWGGASVGESEIKFDEIGAALRDHGTALRKLRLDPKDAEEFSGEEHDAPLGDLTSLTSLRSLTVPQAALLGENTLDDEDGEDSDMPPSFLASTLPHSIETLRILLCDNEDVKTLDEQLWHLMSDKEFSALKAIRMNRSEKYSRVPTQLGWSDPSSNKFWVVLEKHGQDDSQVHGILRPGPDDPVSAQYSS
ncbi:Uu.00g023240.m01.CDS01 [Anthostomella pinea]|uniref:Uu.00g023240.m01.CDS01 n=1 Tax=Anthostomella pinea TaxID=933095 RepID=A0AAI8W0Y3_9PEZI|nr:Uu.00g023240.m01.CDS01 [Anthostomella pinea]